MNINLFPDLVYEKIKKFTFDGIYTKEEKKNFCLLSKYHYDYIKNNNDILNIISNASLTKYFNNLKNFKIKSHNMIEIFSIKFARYFLPYIYSQYKEDNYIIFNDSLLDKLINEKKINNIIFKRFFILKHMKINFKSTKKQNKLMYYNKSKKYTENVKKISEYLDLNNNILNIVYFKDYIYFLESLDMINIFKLCFISHKKRRIYKFETIKFNKN